MYLIVQILAGKNFGELVISKFWRGKLWRMLETCIIGRRKTLANEDELSFVKQIQKADI